MLITGESAGIHSRCDIFCRRIADVSAEDITAAVNLRRSAQRHQNQNGAPRNTIRLRFSTHSWTVKSIRANIFQNLDLCKRLPEFSVLFFFLTHFSFTQLLSVPLGSRAAPQEGFSSQPQNGNLAKVEQVAGFSSSRARARVRHRHSDFTGMSHTCRSAVAEPVKKKTAHPLTENEWHTCDVTESAFLKNWQTQTRDEETLKVETDRGRAL